MEFAKTEGYGHSTVEYVVDMAMSVGVKKLALFHHDPQRTDTEVDEIQEMARARVAAAGGSLEVFAAADFSTVELEGVANRPLSKSWTTATKPNILPEQPLVGSALTSFVERSQQQVVISHAQRDLFADLESDGLRVNHIAKGTPFVQAFRDSKPALSMVQYDCAGDDVVFKNCQRLRECYGNWGKEVPYLVVAFCGHAILQKDLLVIPDATQDDRFADNPLVADGLKVRFYAGCPLAMPNFNDPSSDEVYNIGTLCIIDQRPRDLDENQKNLLRDFGAMLKNEIMTFASSALSGVPNKVTSSHNARRNITIQPTDAKTNSVVPSLRFT